MLKCIPAEPSECCAGCTLADLDGNTIVQVTKGASASFMGCSFVGNTLMPSNTLAGVIETARPDVVHGQLDCCEVACMHVPVHSTPRPMTA